MTFAQFLCAIYIVLAAQVSAQAVEIDVYILTGQSNSLGTTSLESPSDPGTDPADAQTSFFWSNVNASNTVYPPVLYGDSAGAITTLQTQQGSGVNGSFWGPEFGLARTLASAGQTDVMVIKASRGGGGNGFWDKTVFDGNNNSGHMWGHLVDTVDTGLAEVSNAGDTFTIKGFMYLQGESNNGAEAAIAGTRLADLIGNLQTHINTAYPNTADEMHTVVGEIAASGSNANRILTTQLQMNLSDGDPDISFVATSDLPLKSDGIHFGRDAKLTIGERFADAFIGASEQPNGVIGDVNQDGSVTSGTGDPLTDDVTAFLAGWRSDTSGLTNLEKTLLGDLNVDGVTSLADAFILHRALETQGLFFPFEALTAVPEPSSCGLMSVGGFFLLKCKRQRRRR